MHFPEAYNIISDAYKQGSERFNNSWEVMYLKWNPDMPGSLTNEPNFYEILCVSWDWKLYWIEFPHGKDNVWFVFAPPAELAT